MAATLVRGGSPRRVLPATPTLAEVRRHFAAREGARVRVLQADGAADSELAWLLAERVVSVNTAAAGGNASLMSLGPDA